MNNISSSFRDLSAQCGDPSNIAALSNSVTVSNGGILAETKLHTSSQSNINPMEVNSIYQQQMSNQRIMSGPPLPLITTTTTTIPTSLMIQQSNMLSLQQQQAQMMVDQMFDDFQGKLQLQPQQQQQQQQLQQNDLNNGGQLIRRNNPMPMNHMMVQSNPHQYLQQQQQPRYGPMMSMSRPMMPVVLHPSMMAPMQNYQPYYTTSIPQQIITAPSSNQGFETLNTIDKKEEEKEIIQKIENENIQQIEKEGKEQEGEEKFDLNEELLKNWMQQFESWNPVDNMNWNSYMDAINPLKQSTTLEYEFQKENPYYQEGQESSETSIEKQERDYMKEGLHLMKEGKLSEAILAFEACVRKETNRSEAWRYLGQCHADNEDEKPAIAAYLKCHELDPYDLDALLALGVSYTNEVEFFQALRFLEAWIANHPEYCIITQTEGNEQNDILGGWRGTSSEHKKVVDLFQKALEINSHDADLHIVLGVLYNLTNEYDLAELHFKRALQARPKDPSLWNKLGATQANGHKCDIAINAYSKALELKPNYVRALSNLGISFANQKMYREACQSYLASLRLNPQAESVWNNLNMSLMHLGRDDLIKLGAKRNVSLFEGLFDF